MTKSKKLLYNTLLLIGASMLLRAIGVYFQVYLSNKIGASGIGLFQLISSVQSLALTIAISGIRFATTRMVSEEIGMQRPGGVHRVLRHCLIYAMAFGLISGAALYNGSDYIGNVWIGDSRTILSLKLMSFLMPFASITAVMGGYFTAVQRVIKTASVQLIDTLIMIAATVLFLYFVPSGNLEYSCAAVVAGCAVAEICSFFILAILFLHDKKRLRGGANKTSNITKRLLSISMPLALSAYARSALSTLEHMLVPRGLKKSGVSSEHALDLYGIVHGMVFPVLFFPSVIFYSISELLVPELTENQVAGKEARIEYLVNKILTLCLFFSIAVAGIFAFYHKELGSILYQSQDVSHYILVFSFLMPVIYMDAITDGMLKGLGQQLHSMAYNIADSLISVILVYTLLPIYAIKAYVFIVFFTECFNFFLSIRRISKVTILKIRLMDILVPIMSIICAVNLTMAGLRFLGLVLTATVLSLVLHIAISVIIYCFLLVLFSCITTSDIKWFKNLLLQ